jgi:hypothetical protein
MSELDRLEEIARAATPRGTCNLWHPRDHNNHAANQAFCDAFDAETVLELIETIRIAHIAMKWEKKVYWDALRAALEELTCPKT